MTQLLQRLEPALHDATKSVAHDGEEYGEETAGAAWLAASYMDALQDYSVKTTALCLHLAWRAMCDTAMRVKQEAALLRKCAKLVFLPGELCDEQLLLMERLGYRLQRATGFSEAHARIGDAAVRAKVVALLCVMLPQPEWAGADPAKMLEAALTKL